MTYTTRALNFTFQLGKGSFGAGGYNTVKISGLRASVVIQKNGVPSMNTATLRVYGMTPDQMAKLSSIGQLPSVERDNIVSVEASTDQSGVALAYSGGIYQAWQDFVDQPETAFNIIAYTAYLAALKPVAPTSYNGAVDVATVIQTLSAEMGYTFENNGVSVMLNNPYFTGDARSQAIMAAEAANIYVVIDDEKQTIAILPKNGARAGDTPEVSPETGMIGYPSYVGPGQILIRTLYNPAIRFMGKIQVKSSLSSANGVWAVNRLTHLLESQQPRGRWETEIQGNLYLAGR